MKQAIKMKKIALLLLVVTMVMVSVAASAEQQGYNESGLLSAEIDGHSPGGKWLSNTIYITERRCGDIQTGETKDCNAPCNDKNDVFLNGGYIVYTWDVPVDFKIMNEWAYGYSPVTPMGWHVQVANVESADLNRNHFIRVWTLATCQVVE